MPTVCDGMDTPLYQGLSDALEGASRLDVCSGYPYAFVGLWEHWEGEDGRENKRTTSSTTIITTEANDLVGEIYHWMPTIFAPESYATWLDTSIQETDAHIPLLAPCPSEQMEAYPVST